MQTKTELWSQSIVQVSHTMLCVRLDFFAAACFKDAQRHAAQSDFILGGTPVAQKVLNMLCPAPASYDKCRVRQLMLSCHAMTKVAAAALYCVNLKTLGLAHSGRMTCRSAVNVRWNEEAQIK